MRWEGIFNDRAQRKPEEKAALFSAKASRSGGEPCRPDQCFMAYWYYSQQAAKVKPLQLSKWMLGGCNICACETESPRHFILRDLLWTHSRKKTHTHTLTPASPERNRARILFSGKIVSSHTFIPIIRWQNRHLYCWDNDVRLQPVSFIFSKQVTLGTLAEAVTSAWRLVRGTMRALSREQNCYLSLYTDKIHTGALYGSENGC